MSSVLRTPENSLTVDMIELAMPLPLPSSELAAFHPDIASRVIASTLVSRSGGIPDKSYPLISTIAAYLPSDAAASMLRLLISRNVSFPGYLATSLATRLDLSLHCIPRSNTAT